MTRAAGAWAPPALWAILIFVASSGDLPGAGPRLPHLDKAVHVFVYAVLGFLTSRAMPGTVVRIAPARAAVLGALLAFLYGASDEAHQAFVPGRTPEILDLAADLVGAALGAALWARVGTRRRAAGGRAAATAGPPPRGG